MSKTVQGDSHEMVLEKDITFYSTCEHHLMPFYGKAHVAYIPDGRVLGLSKLARTVETFARRLQIQEQLTVQIADALMEHLAPRVVMVMMEAEHRCITMRGIKKPGSRTVSIATRGVVEGDMPVSYTHLDVYKRQSQGVPGGSDLFLCGREARDSGWTYPGPR